tara:strand:- start:54352 stop:54642 length:291 start_codon:yes stop_codon:yes gene_type:complete
MVGLSASAKRKFAIVAAITNHNAPTLAFLSESTGIPSSSLKRQIAQLRSDYGMDIRFVEEGGNKGRIGHYHIFDWGVLDRAEVLVRHSQNFAELGD